MDQRNCDRHTASFGSLLFLDHFHVSQCFLLALLTDIHRENFVPRSNIPKLEAQHVITQTSIHKLPLVGLV